MAIDLPVVLRLPRLDQSDEGYVLLHVSSEGRHRLDLKLIGTDNESVFSVSFKHNSTSTLRDRNFKGNQDELDDILASVLLGTGKDDTTAGLEAVAKIQNNIMTVTIQRHVEGIVQRFANLVLPDKTEDESVELFNWIGLTVESRNKATAELDNMKKELAEQELATNKLKTELEDLINLKTAHEDSLIEKFSLLLNEKKLKIRDQQRLLATATVDPIKLAALEEDRGSAKSRSPGPSRGGKRKANDLKGESGEESDDGFEKMEVDEPANANDSEEDQPQTPDPESTADEASDDEDVAAPLPIKRNATATKGKGKKAVSKASTSKAPEPVDPELAPPPPKRELPFAKKKSAPPPKPAPPPAQGSDTESDDDDEL